MEPRSPTLQVDSLPAEPCSAFLSGKGGLVVGRLGWGREKEQLCEERSPGVVMYWSVYTEGVREEEEGRGQEKGI